MLEDGIEHDSLVPQYDLENPSKRLQYWFSNQGDPLAPFRKTTKKRPVSASIRKRRRKLWKILALSVIALLLTDILLRVLTEDTSNYPIKDDASASLPLVTDFPNQSALFLGDSMIEVNLNFSLRLHLF